MRGPEYRDLVGDEPEGAEAERLRRVHDLLVEAGPSPELPPALAEPPRERPARPLRPRRRREAWLVLAAALAAAAFGGGYLAGHRSGGPGFTAVRTVAMHGTAKAAEARGSIEVGAADGAGNWPLLVRVSGLPRLPRGSQYQLYLTEHGKPIALCGIFEVESGVTAVRMSVPYALGRYDGWVVVRRARGGPPVTLLST